MVFASLRALDKADGHLPRFAGGAAMSGQIVQGRIRILQSSKSSSNALIHSQETESFKFFNLFLTGCFPTV